MRRGLVASRTEAREAILAGRVRVAGRPALKPAWLIAPDEPVVLEGPVRPYVSRGGEKLAPALQRFGVDPAGRRCLDAGAATGGFTDVLLSFGAAQVVAVDVGYGQLAWRLREDERVTVMERTNVRDLRPEALPFAPELLVADLSFISIAKVLPALTALAAAGADLVLLIKPQFEAGRGDVGSGGVVRDPQVWLRTIHAVAKACEQSHAGPRGVMASPVRGPAGNVEFLLHARMGAAPLPLGVDAALAEAPA